MDTGLTFGVRFKSKHKLFSCSDSEIHCFCQTWNLWLIYFCLDTFRVVIFIFLIFRLRTFGSLCSKFKHICLLLIKVMHFLEWYLDVTESKTLFQLIASWRLWNQGVSTDVFFIWSDWSSFFKLRTVQLVKAVLVYKRTF